MKRVSGGDFNASKAKTTVFQSSKIGLIEAFSYSCTTYISAFGHLNDLVYIRDEERN